MLLPIGFSLQFFDFVRQIIDNPSLADQLPDKCDIDFIEKDFSALSDKELANKKLVKVSRTFEIVKPRRMSRVRKSRAISKAKLK